MHDVEGNKKVEPLKAPEETKDIYESRYFYCAHEKAHNLIIIIIATSVKLFLIVAFLLHFHEAYNTA